MIYPTTHHRNQNQQKTMPREPHTEVYLLQFYNHKDYTVYTIGAYSSIENVLRIDTEKEFKFSDGEYHLVCFELDSTKAKTLKTKIVWSNGATEGWQAINCLNLNQHHHTP